MKQSPILYVFLLRIHQLAFWSARPIGLSPKESSSRVETRTTAATAVLRGRRRTTTRETTNDNSEVHALLRLPRGSNKRDDMAGRPTEGGREREIAAVLGQYVPKLFYSGRHERTRERETGERGKEKIKMSRRSFSPSRAGGEPCVALLPAPPSAAE